MRKTLSILIIIFVVLTFGSEGYAFSETLQIENDLSGLFDDEELQGCILGDELSCYNPLAPGETLSEIEPGDMVFFRAFDVDGNPVNSAELFSGKKVTMVKIWATTCGHCIHELPALAQLNDEFEPLGAQVIGIVYNAVDADDIQEAEEIIRMLNVDFPNLLPNEGIRKLFQTQVFPATFFIDEKGMLLADPVLGSRFSEYEELLNQYLSQE